MKVVFALGLFLAAALAVPAPEDDAQQGRRRLQNLVLKLSDNSDDLDERDRRGQRGQNRLDLDRRDRYEEDQFRLYDLINRNQLNRLTGDLNNLYETYQGRGALKVSYIPADLNSALDDLNRNGQRVYHLGSLAFKYYAPTLGLLGQNDLTQLNGDGLGYQRLRNNVLLPRNLYQRGFGFNNLNNNLMMQRNPFGLNYLTNNLLLPRNLLQRILNKLALNYYGLPYLTTNVLLQRGLNRDLSLQNSGLSSNQLTSSTGVDLTAGNYINAQDMVGFNALQGLNSMNGIPRPVPHGVHGMHGLNGLNGLGQGVASPTLESLNVLATVGQEGPGAAVQSAQHNLLVQRGLAQRGLPNRSLGLQSSGLSSNQLTSSTGLGLTAGNYFNVDNGYGDAYDWNGMGLGAAGTNLYQKSLGGALGAGNFNNLLDLYDEVNYNRNLRLPMLSNNAYNRNLGLNRDLSLQSSGLSSNQLTSSTGVDLTAGNYVNAQDLVGFNGLNGPSAALQSAQQSLGLQSSGLSSNQLTSSTGLGLTAGNYFNVENGYGDAYDWNGMGLGAAGTLDLYDEVNYNRNLPLPMLSNNANYNSN